MIPSPEKKVKIVNFMLYMLYHSKTVNKIAVLKKSQW